MLNLIECLLLFVYSARQPPAPPSTATATTTDTESTTTTATSTNKEVTDAEQAMDTAPSQNAEKPNEEVKPTDTDKESSADKAEVSLGELGHLSIL